MDMKLKFNDAKTVRPNHLERCLCYDKFLKGYRCYVYDDISKYWCTQATTEHDPNGDNHIVDYADYQVTKWASLQQEQPEVIDHICSRAGIPAPYMDGNQWCILKGDNIQVGVVGFGDTKEDALVDFIKNVPIQQERVADASKMEQPGVDLSEETITREFHTINDRCFNEGIEGWQKEKLIARHFYELGRNARKEE